MPKAPKCTPCLSSEVRALLLESFPALEERLAPVAACEEGMLIELCSKPKKAAAAPSAYRTYMQGCFAQHDMKGGKAPEVMKECAAGWKTEKAKAAA